jgi:hypothetical protein
MRVLNNLGTAKYVSELLLEINGRLNESLEKVESTCGPEDFAAYRRRVGVLVNSIFEEFLEPIYIDHPELKPPELKM